MGQEMPFCPKTIGTNSPQYQASSNQIAWERHIEGKFPLNKQT
jgi:hypothetical protein